MKCGEVRIKLSEHLDGELSFEERKLVDEHLKGCEGCRGALAELKGTVGRLRAIGEVEPPPWFTQKVMQRVREESGSKKGLLHRLFFPLRVKLPVEALAVALVAVAAMYIFNVVQPEVQMKVAMEPLAEAPAPAEPEEGAVALRGETKESAPPEQRVLGLGNEVEDRADVIRKSAEPDFRAKKLEAAPENAYAPQAPAIGESAATAAKGGAEMEKDLAFEESYPAAEARRKVAAERAEFKMSLSVPDVIKARGAVEEAIKKVGGRIINEETVKENVVVAEVATAKIADLAKELEAVGEVNAAAMALPVDYAVVRIEIREKP